MLADEVGQRVAEVGRLEQREPGDLVGEHPQPHLVERDLPLGGERLDVRRDEGDGGRLAGDRQVVAAERPRGEATDHRSDRHAEHRRRHHPRQPGHHRHHRVAARLRRRRPRPIRPERGGHLGEQVAVGLERLGRPLRPGHGAHLTELVADADHVGDVHPGDAGEVLVGEALLRADVAPRRARQWRPSRRTVERRPSSAAPGRRAPWRGRRTAAARRTGWAAPAGRRRPAARPEAEPSDMRLMLRAFASAVPSLPMSVAVNWDTDPISVSISGAEGSLGSRVLAGLEADPSIVLPPPTTGPIDVVVHLGSGDPDARARRRENVTEGVDRTLAEAIARDADHLVFVSSAMVYGAWPNNPVPLTEDAILRPDVDFVYARQLAAAEAMADRWRRQRPGRTVAVLRPVVSMAADGIVAPRPVAGGGTRRALRRGRSCRPVPPPRRPRRGRHPRRAQAPRRRVQRRPGRVDRR